MITKKFGVDFFSEPGTLTLPVQYVCENTSNAESGEFYERKHGSGWKIRGQVKEDYYKWVNAFQANHPKYGWVWGDFEQEVYADSEEGFKHFYNNHPPKSWDKGDI